VVETVEDGRGEACDGVFEGCGRSWEREQNGALGGSRRAVAGVPIPNFMALGESGTFDGQISEAPKGRAGVQFSRFRIWDYNFPPALPTHRC